MPKSQPLEYAPAEPAFLRRLKAGQISQDGRHNVQIPRARGNMGKSDRLNMKGEDGDDDPVVLDESGEIVSREEMEVLKGRAEGSREDKVGGDGDGGVEGNDDGNETGTGVSRTQESNVSSGFGRKRKAAKVIGGDGEGHGHMGLGEDDEADREVKSLKTSTKDLQDAVRRTKQDTAVDSTTSAAATKAMTAPRKNADGPALTSTLHSNSNSTSTAAAKTKKKKKIKLSFDEPE